MSAIVGISKDFCDRVSGLLERLEQVDKKRQSDETPIPILAAPTYRADDIRDAYDMNVIAPETITNEGDEEPRMKHERLAYEIGFEITSTEGVNLVADAILGKTRLGSLKVDVDMSDLGRVEYNVIPNPEPGKEGLLQEVVALLCSDRRLLQIRYESGHTLSDGVIFSVRFRDVQFDNWVFPDLSGIDICKEKPTKRRNDHEKYVPEAIGTSDSLFCWISRHWPNTDEGGFSSEGWLICDDGSMEIADFIHLDTSKNPPLLSLIHVKGSRSPDPDRLISVSDYEAVTAQAQKNLRFLDRLLLEKGLEQGIGTRKWKLVWHDGVRQPDRTEMLAVLRQVGGNHMRRVVIVQPRLSRIMHKSVRAEKMDKKLSGSRVRLLQLETMLTLSASACRALGAQFLVVGDGTPARAHARTVPSRRARSR